MGNGTPCGAETAQMTPALSTLPEFHQDHPVNIQVHGRHEIPTPGSAFYYLQVRSRTVIAVGMISINQIDLI